MFNEIEYPSKVNGNSLVCEYLLDIGYIENKDDMKKLTFNDFRNIIHIITNGFIELPPFEKN